MQLRSLIVHGGNANSHHMWLTESVLNGGILKLQHDFPLAVSPLAGTLAANPRDGTFHARFDHLLHVR